MDSDIDRCRVVLIAAMLPVAALTAPWAPWKWGFVFVYVATAFTLKWLVRLKNPEAERFAHIFVLSGSAPLVVRWYFGDDLATVGVVHVATVLAISVGLGYLLGDRVRSLSQRRSAA